VSVIARLSSELKAAGRFEEVRVAKSRDPFPSSSRRFLVVPSGEEVQVIGRELNPLEQHYAASKGKAARYAIGVPEDVAPRVASQLKNVFAGKQVKVLSAEAVEKAVREGRLNPESHSKTELAKLLHNERLEPSLSGAQRQKLSAEINAIHSAEAAIAYAYSHQPGHKHEIEQTLSRQLKSHSPGKGQEVNAAALVQMVKTAASRVGDEDAVPYGARAYGARPYGAKPYGVKEKEGGEYLKLVEKEATKEGESPYGAAPYGVGEPKPRGEKPSKEPEKKESEKEEKPVERVGGGDGGAKKEEKPKGGGEKPRPKGGLSWISPKGVWSSPSSNRWLIIAGIVVFIIFLLMTIFS